MINKFIKIFARLKKEQPETRATYHVYDKGKDEMITFYANRLRELANNKPNSHSFRFNKVFGEQSSQEEVFNTIAKPIVKSVIDGFNGTIFAYGQTGSGKTYAMTGDFKKYKERGIIPRSIEEIFEIVSMSPQKYTVYISYLEIYNETAYDLLNSKQQDTFVEELSGMQVANFPIYHNAFYDKHRARRISLVDAGKGEFHLRNLRVYKVTSKEEALQLLLLGDTHRITVATPMNDYSSRSHCIFTICLISKNRKSGKLRRSKLTLVDLAGSERASKSNITGKTLNETKSINLSLHYLEQVVTILALGKGHVPFRNSLLTYLLKDSLTGNCLTILLATLAMSKINVQQTIATCKFAQRVADVSLPVKINEEVRDVQEIIQLRKEIEDLRKRLVENASSDIKEPLSQEEQEKWKNIIDDYLKNTDQELPESNFDARHVRYCFNLLKQSVKENNKSSIIDQYKKTMQEQEAEILFLKSLLSSDVKQVPSPVNLNRPMSQPKPYDKENIAPRNSFSRSLENFQSLDKNTLTEIHFYRQSIKDIFELAKNTTTTIQQCQKNIINLKSKIVVEENRFNLVGLERELNDQQNVYRFSLAKLEELKIEAEYYKTRLEKAKSSMPANFKWSDSKLMNNLSVNIEKLYARDSESRKNNNLMSISKSYNEMEKTNESIVHKSQSKAEYYIGSAKAHNSNSSIPKNASCTTLPPTIDIVHQRNDIFNETPDASDIGDSFNDSVSELTQNHVFRKIANLVSHNCTTFSTTNCDISPNNLKTEQTTGNKFKKNVNSQQKEVHNVTSNTNVLNESPSERPGKFQSKRSTVDHLQQDSNHPNFTTDCDESLNESTFQQQSSCQSKRSTFGHQQKNHISAISNNSQNCTDCEESLKDSLSDQPRECQSKRSSDIINNSNMGGVFSIVPTPMQNCNNFNEKVNNCTSECINVSDSDGDYVQENSDPVPQSRLYWFLKRRSYLAVKRHKRTYLRKNKNTSSYRQIEDEATALINEGTQRSRQLNDSALQNFLEEKQRRYYALPIRTVITDARGDKLQIDNYDTKSTSCTGQLVHVISIDSTEELSPPPTTSPKTSSSTDVTPKNSNYWLLKNEPREFQEFMRNVPLTGDVEVDEEIIDFYRSRFTIEKKKKK